VGARHARPGVKTGDRCPCLPLTDDFFLNVCVGVILGFLHFRVGLFRLEAMAGAALTDHAGGLKGCGGLTALGYTDLMRAELAAAGIKGKRLTYRRPRKEDQIEAR
jgi:hypothetical protein